MNDSKRNDWFVSFRHGSRWCIAHLLHIHHILLLPRNNIDILFDLCEIVGIKESVTDGSHQPPVYGYCFGWQTREEGKKVSCMTPHGWKWRQSSNGGKKEKEENSEKVGKGGLTSKYFYYKEGFMPFLLRSLTLAAVRIQPSSHLWHVQRVSLFCLLLSSIEGHHHVMASNDWDVSVLDSATNKIKQ